MSVIERRWTIYWTADDPSPEIKVRIAGVSGPVIERGAAVEVVPASQLQGAVDLLRRAEPYVRAARHESDVTCATALADEIMALLPRGGQ